MVKRIRISQRACRGIPSIVFEAGGFHPPGNVCEAPLRRRLRRGPRARRTVSGYWAYLFANLRTNQRELLVLPNSSRLNSLLIPESYSLRGLSNLNSLLNHGLLPNTSPSQSNTRRTGRACKRSVRANR